MFVITAYEGQGIRVGDKELTVGVLKSPGLVELFVSGEPSFVLVSSDRLVEIFPSVFVSMERNKQMSNKVKLLFNAPREVLIREHIYEPPP